MEHNPYAAPQAKVEISPRQRAAPRPLAVWLMTIFLLLFFLMFVVFSIQFLMSAFYRLGEVRSIPLLVGSVAWRLLLAALILIATRSVYRGRPRGRWVGVAAITSFALFSLLGADTTHYANDAERAGGQIGRIFVLPLLFAWWAYAFAFSAKAKRYFSAEPTSEV